MNKINHYDILVFGEVLFDCFHGGEEHLGGAPLNVAWHLRGFGFTPLLVSAVGVDTYGQRALLELNKWGLDLSGISKLSSSPTGRVDIFLEDGEPAYTIHPQMAYDQIRAPDSVDAKMLYFGSLALREEVSRTSLKSIKESFKGQVFIDINIRDPWFMEEEILPLLKGADWIKINHEEFTRLLKVPYVSDSDSLKESVAKGVDIWGIKNWIITEGASGVWIYRDGEITFTPAVEAHPFVSAVGAGDGFSAAFISGLLLGNSAEESAQEAVKFASLICQQEAAISTSSETYI